MHAPPGLLIVCAVLGVIIPLAANAATQAMDSAPAVIVLRVISLAAAPLIATRVAYRQGYDRASLGNPSPAPTEADRR
jgi:hypothetical protein